MSKFPEQQAKEILGTSPFTFGIAVSDVANEINPDFQLPDQLSSLFSYLEKERIGAELQLESKQPLDTTNFEIVNKLPFLGLHLPIQGIDLQDEEKRENSRKTNLHAFDIARILKADYVVAHMLTHEEWDRLDERENMIIKAKKDFTSLTYQAVQAGYTGDILFENLEFPLYPSTKEEIIDCVNWLRDINKQYAIHTGFALDISHLWHTGKLIAINRSKGSSIEKQLQDPFVNLQTTFEEYLSSLLDTIKNDIQLIHMTGSQEHDTHRMPSITEVPNVTDHEALDLGASMKLLKQKLSYHSHIWTVNEAHHFTYEQMTQTTLDIQNHI